MVTAHEPLELKFSDAERKVLREKYARLTDVEFEAFLDAARRYQLNPLANQIYARLQEATARNPRAVTYMTQIDGARLIADRTGAYAGNDDPTFDNESKPSKATVTVHKIVGAQRCPFTASARMSQYRPAGNAGFMWDRMPHLMLGKCAESLALRKAFPAELSGIYTLEEMEQAGEHPESKPTEMPTAAPKDSASPQSEEIGGLSAEKWAALKNWPLDPVVKMVAVAADYVTLEKLVDSIEGGDVWLDLRERGAFIDAVRTRYKALVAAKQPIGKWNQAAFIEKMVKHREKLDLEIQADEAFDKQAQEAVNADAT